MKWSKCIIYGVLFLFSTSTLGQEREAIPIKEKKFSGFIFDSLLLMDGRIAPDLNLYMLSKADVYRAEKILQVFFNKKNRYKYKCCIDFPLRNYYRQYYGYYKNGDKIISINFVHRHFIKKEYKILVRKRLIDLDDGGRRRFNMEINLSKGYILFIDSNARGGSIYERE